MNDPKDEKPNDKCTVFMTSDDENKAVEILKFYTDGRIEHMGREITTDDEIRAGIKQWLSIFFEDMVVIPKGEYEGLKEKAWMYDELDR